MQTTEPTRIYLAGPDIYHPDAAQRGQAMLELCASYGHRATFPLTQPFPKGNKRDRSIWIYSTNTRLIRNSDLIIANLNPYQGDQPDSGTVFEIGLAIGHRISVQTDISIPLCFHRMQRSACMNCSPWWADISKLCHSPTNAI